MLNKWSWGRKSATLVTAGVAAALAVAGGASAALGSADVGVKPANATISATIAVPVTMTAVVTNLGPADAKDTKLRYLLPIGVRAVSATISATAAEQARACTITPILDESQYKDTTGRANGPFFARNLVTCNLGFVASGVYSPKHNTRTVTIVGMPVLGSTGSDSLIDVGASNPDPVLATNNYARVRMTVS
jgi:uncharacterized repeat protein (TIGR01451 family)